MNVLERMKDKSCKDGVGIIEYNFNSHRIKGLYTGGTIAINKNIETTTEKACVLAEELGHHYPTVGNILDLSQVENRKQERHARLWGYNKMAELYGLIRAYERGCTECHEIAEYLEVTPEFLHDAIECYRDKYGVYKKLDNYVIYFIPHLTIGQMV